MKLILNMRIRFLSSLLLAAFGLVAVSSMAMADGSATATSVKSYLLDRLTKMNAASEEYVKNSEAYVALVAANGGKVDAAYAADPKKMDALVEKLQKNYKTMDSYGYETVEGIVAGVPSLAKYDIYLDAGVPASKGPENVAPVVLDLGNGKTINKQGCLFTYLIEPMLWAGDKRWVEPVDGGKKFMPKPEVLLATAKDVNKKLGELLADARKWNASEADCFGAMITMTPTLSDYFDDWKESRYAKDKSGRFQAVSRVSDMRGIMGSCQVMYGAVEKSVSEKDKALGKSVTAGFKGIMAFLDKIEAREKQGEITAAEIDELATQAKEKTDKLVPQIEQSAAVAGVKVSS